MENRKMVVFKRADQCDIDAIVSIYSKIHTLEEGGQITIGWNRSIYPTRETACGAIQAGEMFLLEVAGEIVASGRINQEQVPEYVLAEWEYDVPDDEVMVLHTLTVDPDKGGHGYAKQFVGYYEVYAMKNGCRYLRIDTNVRNARARNLYKGLGYKEVGIVPCTFNGIEGVQLVCMEKKID